MESNSQTGSSPQKEPSAATTSCSPENNTLALERLQRRQEREDQWLDTWARIWTKPRRASVASCQHQILQQAYNFGHQSSQSPIVNHHTAAIAAAIDSSATTASVRKLLLSNASQQQQQSLKKRNLQTSQSQTGPTRVTCAATDEQQERQQTIESDKFKASQELTLNVGERAAAATTADEPASSAILTRRAAKLHRLSLGSYSPQNSGNNGASLDLGQLVSGTTATCCSDFLPLAPAEAGGKPAPAELPETSRAESSHLDRLSRSTDVCGQEESSARCCDENVAVCEESPVTVLELQGKQRKFFIFSMALKRMISEVNLVNECSKCRSKAKQATLAQRTRRPGRLAQFEQSTTAAQQQPLIQAPRFAAPADNSSSRGVLKSSRSMLIDQLSAGVSSTGSSNNSNSYGGSNNNNNNKQVHEGKLLAKTSQPVATPVAVSASLFSRGKVQRQSSGDSVGGRSKEFQSARNEQTQALTLASSGTTLPTTISNGDSERALRLKTVDELAGSLCNERFVSPTTSDDATGKKSHLQQQQRQEQHREASKQRHQVSLCASCYHSTDSYNLEPKSEPAERESESESGDNGESVTTCSVTSKMTSGETAHQECDFIDPPRAFSGSGDFNSSLQQEPKQTPQSKSLEFGDEQQQQQQHQQHRVSRELNLESLIVESWLDDHPAFVHDYFMRKASRQLVDDWLVAHAKISNTSLSSQLDLTSTCHQRFLSRPVSQHSLNSHLHNLGLRADCDTPGASVVETYGGGGGKSSTTFAGSTMIRPSRSNSQSGTLAPIRKISATDFESRTGSALLRPMVSTTPDGRPTFLSNINFESDYVAETNQPLAGQQRPSIGADLQPIKQFKNSVCGEMSEQHKVVAADPVSCASSELDLRQVKGDKNEKNLIDEANDQIVQKRELSMGNKQLKEMETGSGSDEEVKLIFELVKNICNDLDIRTLLHKILKNIAVLINADKSSLFLVCGEPGDPNRCLVSQLFNVDQDSEVAEPEDCISIPWGTGLVGYVAESGESVNIANCYEDPRFTSSIDQRTGYVTRHMLCAPIFDKRNEIVGVAQVINKRDNNPFSESDEIKFKRYLQFCGIGLRNAQSYEHSQLENRRNQVLLDLARMVFEEQSTIEQVVYRIMLHTQSLLECQRCQVLLIDDGSDDLEQLLQLPSLWTAKRQQLSHGSSFQEELHKPPTWRPQCNTSPNLCPDASGAEGRSPMSASDKCDRSEDEGTESEACSSVSAEKQLQQQQQQQQQQLLKALSSQYPEQSSKLFSLVFDLECDGNDPVMHSSKAEEADSGQHQQQQSRSHANNGAEMTEVRRRFPINIGITGYVAMTGETLNIEDAHSNERFDPKVDENSSFKHKSILCMPIRNGQRQIIGVSQLINKKNGRPFNKNDEDLFEAFAIFCGLGIHNTLMYEKVLKIMAKQRVTFEVLSYHATAPLEEAKKLNMEQIPSCFTLNLASLQFNDFSLDDQFMLKSCLRFFLDLDLMRRFQIDKLVLCNWILSVKKNYRKVTYHPIVGGNGLKASPVRYHNWRHAFNVSQMMFAILVNTQICQALGELETLALLIACLCHDLDHRGTNNSFQIKSASPLAELYSTSTMEHHHFDQCVMILNSQGNQILANLSPEEYSRVIVLLEEAILATDLAKYFQKRERFSQLIDSNQLDWNNNNEHRSLLRCMLMTACDVAAITKPWPIQKVVADLVMSEFYQQGDIEKQELNIEPIDLMNRDKMSKLPEMQIGFIDSICAPIYSSFAKLFPYELSSLLEGCLSNRNLWTELAKSNNETNKPDESLVRYSNNNNSNANNNNHNHSLPKNNATSLSTSEVEGVIDYAKEESENDELSTDRLDEESNSSFGASCSLASEFMEPQQNSECRTRRLPKVDCHRKSV